MSHILIISEKPQSAQKIANAFSIVKKLRVKDVNYYECYNDKQKIVVCSAVGHLFVLGEKGGESWKYPVFDTEWRPLHKVSKANAYVKGYIDTLKSLKKDSTEIVVATDFDIEGEVIGYNVIKQIYGIENSSRMKFSSLTKDSILNAFENRQKTIEVGQKEAGLTRHNLDWFYGINLSRAFTSSIKTASNKFKVLSTGRVQAPALHFLCDKEKEISKFVSQKYYEIYLDGKIKNKKIKAQYFDENKKEEIEIIGTNDFELIDEVDENNNLTGKVFTRKEIRDKKLIKRAASLWILDKNNKVLCEKRSKHKKTYPSFLSKTCGGCVSSKEEPLQSLIREAKEEIGIDIQDLKIEKPQIMFLDFETGSKEWSYIYFLKLDITKEDLKIQKEEIEEVVEFDLKDFEKKVFDEKIFVSMTNDYYKSVISKLKKLQNEKSQKIKLENQKIIYYSTSNEAKIKRLQKIFNCFDTDFKILKVPDYIDVEEVGKSLEEISKSKLNPYLNKKYDYPIISLDSGMFIEGVDLDPLKPKRNVLEKLGKKESDLSQDEIGKLMNEFYQNLAKEKNGKVNFYFEDYFSILINGKIETKSIKRENILTDKSKGELDIFMPIRNLYISKKTNKYHSDSDENDFKLEFEEYINFFKNRFSNQNSSLENDKYKLLDEKKVKEIIKSCQNKDGTIYDINSKKFKQSVPTPFDLTTLQMEASNVFGLSPKRTLEIAQKLYIEGLTSYPRTSSQKFKDTDLKAILKKLEKMPNYKSLVLKVYDVNKKLIPKEGRKDDPAHPCFTEDHILSFYNSKKKIKDIIKNIDDWKLDKQKNSFYKNISLEEVFSFDDINKKICKNTPYKIWKTEFNDKLINIKIDCENLKVTKNHKFLVFDEEGLKYKKSEEIKENDYLFFNDFKEKFSKDIKLKFSDKEILESFSKKNQIDIKNKNKRLLKTFNEIKKFFLNLDNEKIHILSKIVGFNFGDGHISFKKPTENREEFPIASFVGEKKDMEKLKEDITFLGFNSYLNKNKNIKNKDFCQLINKGVFSRILIILGCPFSDKVNQKYKIPKWILKNKIMKRGFLSGIFGAEITKTRIHTKNKRDIRSYNFTQHKNINFKNSLKDFLKSIKKILLDFDIETSEITFYKIKDLRKKDGIKTIRGSFEIKNSRENLINFLSNIELSYCDYKNISFRKALAYLIFKNMNILNKEKKRNLAIELYKNKKLTFSDIEKLLDISKHTIKGWIKSNKGEKENHIQNKQIPIYLDFNFSIPNDLFPKRVLKISQKKFKGFVYDFEIKKSHTYFINNILTHNCIQPTGEISKKLEGQEFKVYDLIVKRFLAVFGTDALKQTTKVLIDINKNSFELKATQILEKNWLEFYEPYSKNEDVILPEVKEDDLVKNEKVYEDLKETKPPKRYTDASIIKELEKRGIGTKCLTKDTKIKLTKNKQSYFVVPMEKLFEYLNTKSQKSKKVELKENKDLFCFTYNNKKSELKDFKYISRRKLEKNEKIFRIKTNQNSFLKITESHPVLIYENKNIEYREVRNLKEGDKILSRFVNDIEHIRFFNIKYEEFLEKISEQNIKTKIYVKSDIILKMKKNITRRELAKKLDVSEIRLFKYEKFKKIPLEFYFKYENEIPKYFYDEQNNKYKNPFPINDLQNLCSILGNLVGDGSIDTKKITKENCFDFRYHNTDLDLINKFKLEIEKIFNIKLDIKKAKKRKNELDKYFIKIPSLIGRIIYILFPEIIQKNCPFSFIKKNYIENYIGSLFDDEGCSIKKEKKLFISNTNIKLLEDCKKLLEEIKIESKIDKKQFKLWVRKVDSYKKFFYTIPINCLRKKQIIIDNLKNDKDFLYKNEIIVSKDFITQTIKEIKEIKYDDYVYDIIDVEKTQNFILQNNLVVSNSTRADILQSLRDRNFIDGKSISVTDLGIKMDEVVSNELPQITDEKLTKEFEEEMESIRENKTTREKILDKAKKELTKILSDIKKNEKDSWEKIR